MQDITNKHVSSILHEIDLKINPPPAPRTKPELESKYDINAAILGKPYSGKSLVCKKLAEKMNLYIINPENILAGIEINTIPQIEPDETKDIVKQSPDAEKENVQTADEKSVPQVDDRKPENIETESKIAPQTELVDESEKVDEAEKTDKAEKKESTKPSPDPEKEDSQIDNEQEETDAADQPSSDTEVVQKVDDTAKEETEKQPSISDLLEMREKLVSSAKSSLQKGKEVDETLLVDIILNEIKLAESLHTIYKGWIIDGFPNSLTVAQLLEERLSGFSLKTHCYKKSQIMPTIEEPKVEEFPFRGFSAVIMINVPNDEIIRRVAGQRVDSKTGDIYHLEFNPPPYNDVSTF